MIVNVDVKDPAAYEEYKTKVPALIRKHGGEYLVRGGKFVILEGDRKPTRLVIFNCGKERCEGPPELCSSPQRHDAMWPEASYRDKVWRRAWLKRVKKRSVPRQDTEVRSARKHAKDWSWRELFHAAAVTIGGERS